LIVRLVSFDWAVKRLLRSKVEGVVAALRRRMARGQITREQGLEELGDLAACGDLPPAETAAAKALLSE
jgi:hypothetical protein